MNYSNDCNQLARDCRILAHIFIGMGRNAWAIHEMICHSAILKLQRRAEAAEKQAADAEYRCYKERGRRMATEIRAEKVEAEAENLRKAHIYMLVDGKELTITQLYDRLAETKARCARLEEARENANEAASKWEGQCKILEQRMDMVVKLLPKIDIGCKLCSNACDTNDYDCVECRVDCKCRYCNSPDGHSNWQFVGWDKVLQEDDHEKSNNCAAWDAGRPQSLSGSERLDSGTAGGSL